MNRDGWSKEIEEDLIVLIKDWLKQTGRTQSELCQNLKLPSSRLPTLIEFLKKDFLSGGIPKVASRLCEVEELWENDKGDSPGQLDLLDEICEDLSKINFNN